MIPNFFDALGKKLLSSNYSASNCMKSLLIFCPKSNIVTSKQCPDAILISLLFWIKFFKVIHSAERKIPGKHFLNLHKALFSRYCVPLYT